MLFTRRRRAIDTLMVVEDEPLIAFDTEYMLTDQGYSVVATVDRVALAVGVIESGVAIDLVLADMRLADGSGLDVARAAAARGIPVLFVTGKCPPEAEQIGIGCLTKPFTQRTLIDAIDAIDLTVEGEQPKKMPSGLRLFGAAPG